MAQITAARTQLSAPQALYVLGKALGSDVRALPMVAAQSAVETAHWRGMWHWNFGNVTAGPGDDYQLLPGLPLHFKVYSSADDGAHDYIRWLKTRGVLDYAMRGDLSGYIDHLKSKGYLGFIGRQAPDGHTISDNDYDQYSRGIASIIHSFDSMLPEPLRGVSASIIRSGSTKARKYVTAAAVMGLGIALAITSASGRKSAPSAGGGGGGKRSTGRR